MFRKIFVSNIGIYTVTPVRKDYHFSDIRFLLDGNTYQEVYGGQVSILKIDIRTTFSSSFTIIDYLSSNPQDLGIVMMKNEIVT